MNRCRTAALVAIFVVTAAVRADDASTEAQLLANAGVLVSHGATKIVFDPLFDNDYGVYDLVPPDMERALFAGEPPFDGLDAVFVSHFHDDHFAPDKMLRLLEAHESLLLFAPQQAVAALPGVLADSALAKRILTIDIEHDEQFRMSIGSLEIGAVRIPHAGWPTSNRNVDNVAFRVSLDGAVTILHLGDANANDRHFQNHADYWQERHSHLALPPFWFYLSGDGQQILNERVNASRSIGVHVPKSVPDDPAGYPVELQGRELFTSPGETRTILIGNDVE